METQSERYEVLHNSNCLISVSDIENIILRLSKEIVDVIQHENPVIVCVMNGGLIFTGHLLTKLKFPLEVDYVQVTRYGKELSGNLLSWIIRPQINPIDRTILLIDDIYDEGITLSAIAKYYEKGGAKQVLSAVLVNKLHDRKTLATHTANFIGTDIEDKFVFGFGLDYKGYWRNAPGIYAINKDLEAKG